jgi:hypothetical protein
MKRIATFLCLLAIFSGCSVVMAQLPVGSIFGVVKDSSGAVVPGADVSARETETNLSRSAVSGPDGGFRFDALPVGTYEITAKANGFQAVVQTGLVLAVGQEAVANFSLEVGAVSQTVSVSAEASNLVSTTTSSLSSLVTPEVIADMPLNGRNYNDLTLLQMGVTKVANSGISTVGYSGTQYSSNGAPQRSNTYMLDGALLMSASDNNGSSAMGTTLGVDGIQEYRIITNNFDAEYGMTMGSQMLVASKSGTNAFHGDAFEFLRNNVLDARNYFDLPAYSQSLNDKRNPEFRRNQFGGAFGGPIQKDKTFFFGVYEGLRAYLGATETSSTLGTLANPNGCHTVTAGQVLTSAQCPQLGVATATGPAVAQMIPFLAFWPAPNLPGTNGGSANNYGWIFPQVSPENYGQVRVDHTFSNSDNLFVRYTIDQSSLPYVGGSFNQDEAVSTSRNQFITLAENHIFSASVVNSARISFTREPLLFANVVLDPRLLETQFELVQQPLGMGSLGPGGVSAIGNGNLSPREEFENLYTVADDVNYNRGKHSFKFGFLVNHYAEKISTHGYDRGIIAFSNLDQFLQGSVSTFTLTLPDANNPTKYLRFATMGFYGQDSWKVMPRLTLNVGMRYEPTTSVNDKYGNLSNLRHPLTDTAFTVGNPLFKNPSLRNWSPRFGFAWDVFGDGKTAIRGGFDLLYDLSTLGTAYMLYAGYDPPFTQNFTTSSYSTIFPGPLQVPARLPALGSFTSTATPVPYNANQPHLMSYNLTLERQLPGQTALTVAFAGSKGLDLLRDAEFNNVLPSGVPVTNNGITTCAQAAPGTVLNNANQIDGTATSCYFYPTLTSKSGSVTQTAVLQCGLLVGLGTPPSPNSGTCFNRLNDTFPNMKFLSPIATSLYNALQVNLTKRVTHGLQVNASYTWSRLMDDSQGTAAQDGQQISGEPLHPNSTWSPALFDLTHVFHVSGIYHFPDFASSKGFMTKVTNGWMINGILSLQTGYPFAATLSSDRENISWEPGFTGVTDVPDVVPGRTPYNITHGVSSGCGSIPAGKPLGTPQLWFDPCAFSIEPAGFIGNERRDFLRGPTLSNVDFSLVKDTAVSKLGEGGKIEFRAEFFDLFNHPNFALPSGTSIASGGLCPITAQNPAGVAACPITPLSTAGAISSTLTNPGGLPGGTRQIQFGLKVMF